MHTLRQIINFFIFIYLLIILLTYIFINDMKRSCRIFLVKHILYYNMFHCHFHLNIFFFFFAGNYKFALVCPHFYHAFPQQEGFVCWKIEGSIISPFFFFFFFFFFVRIYTNRQLYYCYDIVTTTTNIFLIIFWLFFRMFRWTAASKTILGTTASKTLPSLLFIIIKPFVSY